MNFKSDDWFTHCPENKIREDLALMCNRMGLTGYAVEIGVHRGEFTAGFLELWKGDKYFCVDPWQTGLPGYSDQDITPERNRQLDYGTYHAVTAEHRERICELRMCSEPASKLLMDGLFDFVYIDANHTYQHIIADIEYWLPKCKSGGIFAGHDIVNGNMQDVRRAVFERLYHDRGWDIFVIPGDAWSWYCIKE